MTPRQFDPIPDPPKLRARSKALRSLYAWADRLHDEHGAAGLIAGKVVIESVKFDVPSRERQQELDLRIVPWLPSGVQWAYIVALLMGVIGSPVSRRWWQRVWPAEARAEYRNAAGYFAAKITRAAAYLLLFMPVVSIAAMPWHVAERVIYWVKWPFVTWRRLRAKPA